MNQKELISTKLANAEHRQLYLENRIADLRDSLDYLLDNPQKILDLNELEQLAFDAELFSSTYHICRAYEVKIDE